MKSSGNVTAELYIMESQLKNWILCPVSFGPFRWGSGSLCLALGNPPKNSELFMVQDHIRYFSSAGKVKHATRDLGSQGKMSRELLKLRNIGKLVPKSYRDCREYRWKQSWSKRSSNIASFSPSKEQTCRLMAQASSEKANSHAGNPWWFFTGSRPDHDGLSAEDTLDRPFVVYLFPIKGSGDSSFRPVSAQRKIETAVRKSVRRNCWNGFCSVHWIKTLQVRGVDQTPCPIVYCMELRWRQPCSDD